MTINPIPAFHDNYIWVITQDSHNNACVVDPGDAQAVIEYLEAHELTLDSILITHHHNDHIGGVAELKERYSCHVYASQYDVNRFPSFSFTDTLVKEGDSLRVLDQVQFDVMHIPGHTLGHIAYYNHELIFCGDTLFSAGCGRRFEGSVEQFYQSLQRIAQLNNDTLIYCTHEYTLSNIAFAQQVEPDNADLHKLARWANSQRQQGLATLPSRLDIELETNPFLRCHIPNVQQFARSIDPSKASLSHSDIFNILRQQKDQF